MDILFLFATGAIAGLLAGMLGVGGGVVIVPLLAYFLNTQDVGIDVLMHVAIGTSLATIIVTSLSSTWAHHKRQAIKWHVVRGISSGVFVGGLLGALIAKYISGELLKSIFSIFLITISLQMFFGSVAKPHRKLPQAKGMLAVGALIGTISSIVGIGGGSLSVPFLTWCNVNIRNAVATSSAIGFPIAVAGTVGFIIAGWSVEGRPDMMLGFVSVSAFLSIIVASTIMAPVGAWLAHRVSPLLLKRVFAVFLLVVGFKMLFS